MGEIAGRAGEAEILVRNYPVTNVPSKIGTLVLAVTTEVPHRNLELLSPNRDMVFGRWKVLLNPKPGTECDFWVVFTTSRQRDGMRVAPENTLYAAGEPPSKKVHPWKFYSQFYHVHSCNPDDPHPRVVVGAPCLNWHVGLDHRSCEYRFGYDHLAALEKPEKDNRIAVVCSDLRATEGQRERLRFLEVLKAGLGEKMVHYGRGFEQIPDKFDAILPFAYHLVLENSRVPHYWSEKLADAYLGHAFPFYLGAPNLEEYFPQGSFRKIEPARPDEAVKMIAVAIEDGFYKKQAGQVAHARRLILDDYNFFTNLVNLADARFLPDMGKRMVEILSHKAFRNFPKNLIFRMKNRNRKG